MRKTRNRTNDKFWELCRMCRHFHCVINHDGVKHCTYKGRPVGHGKKCSKYKDAQKTLDL